MQEIQIAEFQVQKIVANEIDWFTPPGEKHFDPVSITVGFASALVAAFLAGFAEEAKNAANAAGKRTLKFLKGYIENMFKGQPVLVPEEVEKLATEAPAIAAKLPTTEFKLYLSNVESGLKLQLECQLPPKKAATFAARITEVVSNTVLTREG